MNTPVVINIVRETRFFKGFQLTHTFEQQAIQHLQQPFPRPITIYNLVAPFTIERGKFLYLRNVMVKPGNYIIIRNNSKPLWRVLTEAQFHEQYYVQEPESQFAEDGSGTTAALRMPAVWFCNHKTERILQAIKETLVMTEAEALDWLARFAMQFITGMGMDDTLRNIQLAEMEGELRQDKYRELIKLLQQEWK